MKIPETTANVGAYYGNEENGQWQPNGVILDSGVGGGVVGSGDAGFVHHAPVYPVPRHLASPGYVMAGAYFEPGAAPYGPQPHDDFADYMWMENEEEFDKQVMQQLEEEALMEQCIEAMLEDEQRELRHRPVNGHCPTTSNGAGAGSGVSLEETISRSTLNPLAAEFVPTRPLPSAVPEAVDKPVEVSASQEVKTATEPDAAVDSANEESQSETPEVSAAGVHPITDKPERRAAKPGKKPATKPTIVAEVKKAKPQAIKSETKVPAKKEVKNEAKAVKSEAKFEELFDGPPLPEPAKTLSSPAVTESLPVGPKPINYAAAAKANKPKKASTPPAITPPTEKPPAASKPERTISATKAVVDKGDKLTAPSKDKLKADKPTAKTADRPRKNSAK